MLPSAMTSRTGISAAERRALSRLRQLLNESGIVRGSLIEMNRRCGKKGCACAHDEQARHRSLYLGISQHGKQRMIYIPREWEERAREWTRRYGEIHELLDELASETLRRLERRAE